MKTLWMGKGEKGIQKDGREKEYIEMTCIREVKISLFGNGLASFN